MRRKRSILIATLNFKVPLEIRNIVETFADKEGLTLGEAARHIMKVGINQVV